MSVGVNNFVRRQVEGSGKTYSPHLSFEEIAKYAEKQLAKDQFYVGYRYGVIIIKIDKKLNKNFVCPFVKIKKNTIVIIEASSFQLYYLKFAKPSIASILNITKDHLDWHGTIKNYQDAKIRSQQELITGLPHWNAEFDTISRKNII